MTWTWNKKVSTLIASGLWIAFATSSVAELPPANQVSPVLIAKVAKYSEGIVFDHAGNGYISHQDTITKVAPDGATSVFAVTGSPNGHKILADGSHLVCDASHHAVLHLDAQGKMLEPACKEYNGKPLQGPNDLSLDPAGGFYFTDPGESSDVKPIGTVHYVDAKGKVHLVNDKLAYPNGIVLRPGGKAVLYGESKKNRILEQEVLGNGTFGPARVFADLPAKEGSQVDNQPDGICLDAAGNLYVAHYGMGQVQVLDPKGKLIARYPGGNILTSNVAFGGKKMDQLFVTGAINADGAPGALFRLDLGVPGLVILPAKSK
ncbi:MAG: SMP-30/gluconolactonase/LRE family protein [Planctomycetota bacterium]